MRHSCREPVAPTAAPLVDRLFGSGPVGRQARTHALITAADASFAVSLAGSLFFSVSVDAARPRIMVYLLATMAPFAIVAPLIGPAIDRVPGGQRVVVALTCAARGAICLALAGELRSLLFYPLAFAVLVLGKTYSVAKNVLVPRLVADADALVEANSRLRGSRRSLARLPVDLAPPRSPSRARPGLSEAAAPSTWRPRPPRCGSHGPRPRALARVGVERHELRAPGLRRAAATMGVLRGGEGFLLFVVAFALKQAGEPAWFFGAVFAGNGLGALAGTFAAPRARRVAVEETLLTAAIALMSVVALFAAFGGGRLAVLAVAATLGLCAMVGRRAFDSLVQRDAPDVERGRLFARFETRFQLSWVFGAVAAVVARPPLWVALFVFAAVSGLGALMSVRGRRAAAAPLDDLAPESGSYSAPGLLSSDLLATAEALLAEGSLEQAVAVGVLAVSVGLDGLTRRAGPEAPTVRQMEEGLRGLRQVAVVGSPASAEQADRVLSEARRLVLLAR